MLRPSSGARLAALGVLNSVLMATRQRLHDVGIFKALGMMPSQTITMVLCWVIIPTIIAALIALPVGLIIQDKLVRHLVRHLVHSSRDLILPGSFVPVLGAGELVLLTLPGWRSPPPARARPRRLGRCIQNHHCPARR